MLLSCDRDDSTQQQEEEALNRTIKSIENKVYSIDCSNAADWKIIGVGTKACGGSLSYLPYHKSVETNVLPMVEEYNSAMAAYNKKWNVVSDCSLTVMPRSVECINGKATLKY